MWLDCRKLGIPYEKVHDFLLEKCHLAVNEGTFFGQEGSGFARLNAACPRSQIVTVLDRLKKGCEELG